MSNTVDNCMAAYLGHRDYAMDGMIHFTCDAAPKKQMTLQEHLKKYHDGKMPKGRCKFLKQYEKEHPEEFKKAVEASAEEKNVDVANKNAAPKKDVPKYGEIRVFHNAQSVTPYKVFKYCPHNTSSDEPGNGFWQQIGNGYQSKGAAQKFADKMSAKANKNDGEGKKDNGGEGDKGAKEKTPDFKVGEKYETNYVPYGSKVEKHNLTVTEINDDVIGLQTDDGKILPIGKNVVGKFSWKKVDSGVERKPNPEKEKNLKNRLEMMYEYRVGNAYEAFARLKAEIEEEYTKGIELDAEEMNEYIDKIDEAIETGTFRKNFADYGVRKIMEIYNKNINKGTSNNGGDDGDKGGAAKKPNYKEADLSDFSDPMADRNAEQDKVLKENVGGALAKACEGKVSPFVYLTKGGKLAVTGSVGYNSHEGKWKLDEDGEKEVKSQWADALKAMGCKNITFGNTNEEGRRDIECVCEPPFKTYEAAMEKFAPKSNASAAKPKGTSKEALQKFKDAKAELHELLDSNQITPEKLNELTAKVNAAMKEYEELADAEAAAKHKND